MAGKQWIAVLAAAGFLVAGTATLSMAQQKDKGKAYKQAEDAKKDPNATFDGSKPTVVDPVKIEKSTTTPTVTPTPRGEYVPQQYKSLHTTPPPAPAQQQKQQKKP